MTAPIPEDEVQTAIDVDVPAGEHDDDLTDERDASGGSAAQSENAGTAQDQPSQ